MTTTTKATTTTTTTTRLYQATRDAYTALVRANANLHATKQTVANDDTLEADAKAIVIRLAHGILEQRLRQLAISIELLEEHLLSLAPQMAPGEALKFADQFTKLREAVGTAALAMESLCPAYGVPVLRSGERTLACSRLAPRRPA